MTSNADLGCCTKFDWLSKNNPILLFGDLKLVKTIGIIDIESVLGHESCLHFFSQVPF